jgi:hypothetical protein
MLIRSLLEDYLRYVERIRARMHDIVGLPG